MLFRKRQADESLQRQNPPAVDPPGGNLNEVRQAGQSLFDAADDAIRRALSGNSRAFLEATRQEGGE